MNEAMGLATTLAARFEGFRSRPYICPAGVPTIGYGATRYLDGRRVTLLDQPITREHAMMLLVEHLQSECIPAVVRACPVPMTERQLAALADFTFNLGAARLRASTLRRRVNAGDWEAAQRELGKWVLGGGRVLPGLVARRAAEAALLGKVS